MQGVAEIRARIEICDHDGMPITEIDGNVASRSVEIMRENDRYKALLGDANAKVNVQLNESIGGPYGYSNVKIGVSVTLTCDQNVDSLQKAKQYCLDECLDFIESNIGPAYKMLGDHLARHYVLETTRT